MKVIIVGAGIGGLTAALSLLHKGIDVVVLERAPALTEVGAGIQIGSNGTVVLRELGLEGKISSMAIAPESWDLIDYRTGQMIFTTPLGKQAGSMYGGLLYNVHRADLIGMLGDALPGGTLRLDCECQEVGQSDTGAWVRLVNGEVVEGDVVIGADGIHSVVRKQLWGEDQMQNTGISMWRSLIPADRLTHIDLPRNGNYWIGPGRTIISYWVRDNLYSVLGSVPAGEIHQESWTEGGDVAEFQRSFAEGEPRLQALMEQIDTAFVTGMNHRNPISRWTNGRITLLGDGAHPMVPFLAQGACQGIEDAWALATMLERSGDDIPGALELYEQMRRPRTTRIQSGALAMVKLVHESDEDRIAQRNGRWKGMSRIDPLARATWGLAWNYNILAAVNRPADEVVGVSGVAEGFTLARPESSRAFALWKEFMTPADAAQGHDGMRRAYDRLLLTTLGEDRAIDSALEDLNGVPSLFVDFDAGASSPVALHFHGGGYVVGSARGSYDYAHRLADALGGASVVPDYRLAPEHSYPAALDDALDAYRGLLARGVAPERIILSGESSGAGLAIALAMVLRAADLPAPAGIVAVCPLVDLTLGAASIAAQDGRDPAANGDTLAFLVASYFQGHEPRDPLVSPLFGQFQGLPPMFITAAINEALFDDATRLAERAKAAGVDVTTCWIEDSVHVFPIFDFLPETQEILRELGSWAGVAAVREAETSPIA